MKTVRFDLSLYLLAVLLSLLVYPLSGNATTTTTSFYSVTTTNGGDGYIKVSNLGSWNGAHDATSGHQVSTGASASSVSVSSNVYLDGTFQITRAFLPFDTSTIPDDAIIASSTLYVYPNSRFLSENDAYSYLQPVGPATPASSTKLVVSDYDQAGAVDSPEVWSDSKNAYNDTWSGGYVSFPLNEEGLDGISKTDFTDIAMRLGHDIEDVAPDVLHANGNKWLFYSGSWWSQSRRPLLEVTYVTAN